MRNFKVAQTALEMIVAGHSVETVMNITGLEPDEFMSILDRTLGIKAHIIEWVSQVIQTQICGEIEVNVN